ncbi:structural maintenance of chromosomes protein 6 [Massarina eburnea CBS 473.64]|uniref:Structural maintenance of chromosomes protein 6 n=1 Tax=Massarina eburnea CBS 473.64 TaxID=1395130 RepID=A0A6A6S4K8_9PLEO|nr:structural maintenance of chromosomes protein 6 [Massarina eburnea CBS 473.64]
MAQVLSAKRPRGLTDHHRPSLNGIAGPSRHKRPRHSIDASEQGSSEDDETTSNAPANDADDAAYLRQTQLVEKSLGRSEKERNVPAEVGIIEEVRCTNFMCHDQLTVTLGPLINFIIGENGSGKSAVLTALTVCLGGKASATNRGQNLKAFIKSGKNHASLSVKLKNQGELAYKPDQFGDSIIVERHFSRVGGSGFKLKDQNGRIVSQKKADVEDVLDAFALQIDNPMNVLTQDMARQFLNTSTPKDKYKFFLKGTQLEALDNDYRQIALELDEQEAKAQTMEGDVKVLRNNFAEAVKKAKDAKRLEEARQDEKRFSDQAVWAKVQSEEQQLAEMQTEVDRIAQMIEERKATAEQESEVFANAERSLDQAKEAVAACEAEMQPTQNELAERKAEWGETRKRVLALKADERKLLSALEAGEKVVNTSQAGIENYRNKQAEADNGLHARKVQEYEDARRTYEERKTQWDGFDQNLTELRKQMHEAKKEVEHLEAKLRQKRDEMVQSRTKITDLEQEGRRWFDNYQNPAGLQRLLGAIDNETKFRERPVGPIGRHVELLKPEWGSILEKSFGATLEGFVVTCKDDRDLLSKIMKKLNYQATVFIGGKNRINTTGHEPDQQHLTWMRALKVNNDLVRNSLIINHFVDQVVLIENRADAMEYIRRRPDQRPNTKLVFCMSDTGRRRGHTIAPGSHVSPIEEFKGHFRMQADKGPQLQDERDNQTVIKREMADIQAEIRAAKARLDACDNNVNDHHKEKRGVKIRMDEAHDDMYRLEGEVSNSIPDAAMIEQLEGELADAQSNLEKEEEQFGDLTRELDKADAEARIHKGQLETLEDMVRECKSRLEKLNTRVATFSQRREQALRAKNIALEDVEAAERNKQEWEEKLEGQRKEVEKEEEIASRIVGRVPVPRGETHETLKAKVDRMAARRRERETQLGGSQEELLTIALEAKKVYHDAEKEIKNTAEVRRALKLALKHRQQRWKEFRQGITTRARIVFNYLLSERQFRGTLVVDHENQRLDINVQPDITVDNAAGRQTKTLSGGEKSFSTICLLLALWDAMGSPIRCLDEFDVFMDAANRDVSTTMIIKAARRAIGRQYILITPQSMNNSQIFMDDVKIIRMGAPERGQTSLNFGA